METHTFFLQLLIILVAARLFAEIAVHLGAPAVIGELTAGIILGPSLLGWIQPNEIIRYLAEIGILLLLFEVGLDTDMRKLMNTGRSSAIVALGGFIIPFVLGYLLASLAFDLSTLVSLFIGGALTATSIGITLRVLSDLGQRNSREGQIVLGAAVLDDVLGVVLLALLYEFSIAGGISLANTGKVLAFITLFFLLAPIAAKLISVLIKHVDDASDLPGLIPTAMVSLVLLFAWLAHKMGAPELLGGFAAGLALSRRFFLPFGIALHTETEFSQRIEAQMRPIIQLFTPIFFVMVGLSLNLQEVDWSSAFIWAFSFLFLLVAIIGKFSGALLTAEPIRQRIAIGVAMVPRGEVGLIFAELGRTSGIFDNNIYAGMIMVIALTTLLPPFLLKYIYRQEFTTQ
ncbi:MAG: cation:proton antiporter [Gammaproteobacteria bacterium]|nr:MAG: cation:proton antiporter [Gammaproteobacteria bacterium]RTZ75303.1 MAG: cation:proton antiporter [Gammaproteobacteria bacterium]